MITLGKPKHAEEGIFYMSWESFTQHFSLVDVLFPSVSVDRFSMVADEGHKLTGGCLGACKGCAYFWCLCRGARVLWLHEESDHLKARLQKEAQDKFFSHV